jgi:hypothetical protein
MKFAVAGLEAGVDHLHAGVAEGAGEDFCTAIVAVESGLGDEDTDWGGGRHSSKESKILPPTPCCFKAEIRL